MRAFLAVMATTAFQLPRGATLATAQWLRPSVLPLATLSTEHKRRPKIASPSLPPSLHHAIKNIYFDVV